jgi:hypothetical protein
MLIARGSRNKSCTRGHNYNCGVEMYRKSKYYFIWKVHMRGGVQNLKSFLKTMQNVLKPLAIFFFKMGQKYSC